MTAQLLTIRPARPDEADALHALVERAYRGQSARAGWTHEADLLETPRSSVETLAAVLADPGELLLVLAEGERLVGCVQVSGRAGGAAYLGLLTVDPSRQADGFGKQLIAAAEDAAAERFGAARMELSVVHLRAELIAWYQRRGYRLTGEERPFPVAVEPPLSLLVMEKALG
ncbi:GNAT family N-acetyltransferase [Caulobacter sp. 17J80-11]|uniref:GNAT family N-acetyltransferase n=1 Tax=Caulobacter sp. 17J80-11 TaxID=2763502 RepID=UPI00165394C9|nr:GNAT family N-acetyltransferase [Caulobacter sp. 17J80-11]MBC6981361.1 GNAT family N-acetyltransferase [Caulobacter sp. 17J80-11]